MPPFILADFLVAFRDYLATHHGVLTFAMGTILGALIYTVWAYEHGKRVDADERARLREAALHAARRQMLDTIARARGRE